MIDFDEIRDRVVEATYDQYKEDIAADIYSVPVRWNNRLTSCLGRCYTEADEDLKWHNPKWIELSGMIRRSPADIEATLTHEYCHAAQGLVDVTSYLRQPHGRAWKALMRRAGIPAPSAGRCPVCPDAALNVYLAHLKRLRSKNRQRELALQMARIFEDHPSQFEILKKEVTKLKLYV